MSKNAQPSPQIGVGPDSSGDADEPAFTDVLDAGALLEDLDDAARVEAWASSALGVWAEDPNAAAIDADFVAWLGTVAEGGGEHTRRAAMVCRAIAAVMGDRAGAGVPVPDPPVWVDHLGTSVPTRAWRVVQGGTESLGIGFVSSDGSEHSLLADVVDGAVTALVVTPGPDELFDGSEDLVAPEPVDVADAAVAIVAAWRVALTSPGGPPESAYVNGALGRVRLAAIVGEPLDALRHAGAATDPEALAADASTVEAAPADPERAETDRWALSVLDGAIGTTAVPAEAAGLVDDLLDALVPTRIEGQPTLEREAFGALEWADWLGVVIELVRAGPSGAIDADGLIDCINRCPEVTSSIPKADRLYYRWVLSLLLGLWRRIGVVDQEDRLTALGVAALPAALRRAWSGVTH